MRTGRIVGAIIMAIISFWMAMVFSKELMADLDIESLGAIIMLVMVLIAFSFAVLIKTIRNNKIKHNIISTENLPKDLKFEEMYNEVHKKYAAELNCLRKKLKPMTTLFLLLGGVMGIAFLSIEIIAVIIPAYKDFVVNNPLFMNLLVIGATVLFFVAALSYTSNYEEYKKKYKNGMIKELVKKLNNEFEYTETVENDKQILRLYDIANFDGYPYKRSTVEDCINGNISEKLEVIMADLDLRDEDGDKFRYETTTFNGFIVYIRGLNSFEGTIKILNEKNRMRKENIDNLIEVKMDSSEFEEMFNIYSDNALKAMRILTSDIMQKIVGFEKQLGIHYELMISGPEIFMRFFTADLFEPDMFNITREKDRVRAYYEITKLIAELAKELDKTIAEVEI